MDATELRELLTTEGLRLLDSLPPFESGADVLRTVATLRKDGHAPALVAAVLNQSKLRSRAMPKFGPFAERMLFTEAGLEQATRLKVAALHAGRFRDAGVTSVADLGCGIGADALALAAIDLRVTGVERDEVTAAIAAYNLAHGHRSGGVRRCLSRPGQAQRRPAPERPRRLVALARLRLRDRVAPAHRRKARTGHRPRPDPRRGGGAVDLRRP
jgi:hypothetical protein